MRFEHIRSAFRNWMELRIKKKIESYTYTEPETELGWKTKEIVCLYKICYSVSPFNFHWTVCTYTIIQEWYTNRCAENLNTCIAYLCYTDSNGCCCFRMLKWNFISICFSFFNPIHHGRTKERRQVWSISGDFLFFFTFFSNIFWSFQTVNHTQWNTNSFHHSPRY